MILQLGPSAELADIEAKYSMLVSQLNSIKNDFPDPVKRAAFDSKRSGLGGVPCQSNPKIKVGCSVDVGNPVVVERAAAGCNFDIPYLSEMATCEASEDNAEQQQKKILTNEESCITSQKNSKDGIGLYLKCPEENSSSSSQFISRKRPEPDFYNFENNAKAELSSPLIRFG
ncbi:unnamed protein product [Musa hybrid cultivar]